MPRNTSKTHNSVEMWVHLALNNRNRVILLLNIKQKTKSVPTIEVLEIPYSILAAMDKGQCAWYKLDAAKNVTVPLPIPKLVDLLFSGFTLVKVSK